MTRGTLISFRLLDSPNPAVPGDSDLQWHGRTADIDHPIDVQLMADDIAADIDRLRLDRPDFVGYSSLRSLMQA